MQQHGRATITVNGTRLRSKNGATLLLGGVARAPEALDSGEVAFAESTAAPELNCNIPLTRDTDIEALRKVFASLILAVGQQLNGMETLLPISQKLQTRQDIALGKQEDVRTTIGIASRQRKQRIQRRIGQ